MNRIITNRRRKLLPWWMKIFSWIFMFLGASGVAVLFMELIGLPFNFWLVAESAIYGMETYDSFSLLGIFISILIFFKGYTAFAMWTEKDWAMQFGVIDAAVGIIICVVMMIIYPIVGIVDGTWNINLRLEILFLVPYLIKCWRLRKPWKVLADPIYAQQQTNSQTVVQKTMTPPPAPPSYSEFKHKETQQAEPTIVSETNKNDGIDKEDPRRFMPK